MKPTAWVLLTLTTLGAAACLFVTLILGARILPLFQGRRRQRQPLRLRRSTSSTARPPGGHRAVR